MNNKTRRITLAILLLVIVSMALWLLTLQSRASSGVVEADFINVGEGDSILLRDGNGFDVLIDGGKPGIEDSCLRYA